MTKPTKKTRPRAADLAVLDAFLAEGRAEAVQEIPPMPERIAPEATEAAEGPEEAAMFEDGHDGATHNGGALERISGFDPTRAMTEGLGFTRTFALPETHVDMPPAGWVHYHSEERRIERSPDLPPAAETVCGMDDRVHVTTSAAPPWRMICQLIITMGNGLRTRGTGYFVSPRTVVTAGHCVHSRNHGGWVQSIEVIPGMDGTLRPYGSATSSRFHSVRGWTQGAAPDDDMGCIILPPDQRLGERTGWFGFAALPDAELARLVLNNSGYAGDKAFGTQWYNAGRVTTVEQKRIAYMLDTFGGQSGSPTWRYDAATGRRHAVGIHAYGGCPNRSTRITPRVFRIMQSWKAAGL